MAIPTAELIAQLKRHEGFYSKPYLCTANACTIGHGTNLDAHPKYIPYADIREKAQKRQLRGAGLKSALLKRGMSWSRDQAHEALLDELLACERELNSRCAQYGRLKVNGETVRAEVLLNMAFNMGVPTLMTFKNTLSMLDAAIEGRGSYGAVANGMLNSLWARQVKGRANQLAKQMETGVYQ